LARCQTRKQIAGRETSQLQVLDGYLAKDRYISRLHLISYLVYIL
jgi:hypothetical protein